MPNNELRVFYPANPPSVMTNCISFPHLYSSNDCPFPGLMVEIIGLLARESNLTIRALTAADFGYEPDQLKDVASNGLLDMLRNGTVDLIAMSFQVTQQREKQFSFTETIYKVQTRVLKQPESRKFTKIWAFFSNYDHYVWTAFVIVWLLQWMLGLLVQQMEANISGQKAPPLLESTWKFLRMLLRQPERLRCCSWGGKVSIFLFAFVQCTVLLGLYSSLILANIIKSNDKEVETVGTILDQLMRHERYMVTDAPSKWIFEFINNSLAYPYPEFKRVFKHNPFKITHSVEETLNEVIENNAVVFVQDDDKVNFEARQRCELEAVREGLF
ncbi:hypothetical protein M3Y97_00999400 [Aphelenchoides bicaudatus]|nr:hypothetical protein M3Y97_00999400 [Aphelenchoides bicaudatus]